MKIRKNLYKLSIILTISKIHVFYWLCYNVLLVLFQQSYLWTVLTGFFYNNNFNMTLSLLILQHMHMYLARRTGKWLIWRWGTSRQDHMDSTVPWWRNRTGTEHRGPDWQTHCRSGWRTGTPRTAYKQSAQVQKIHTLLQYSFTVLYIALYYNTR